MVGTVKVTTGYQSTKSQGPVPKSTALFCKFLCLRYAAMFSLLSPLFTYLNLPCVLPSVLPMFFRLSSLQLVFPYVLNCFLQPLFPYMSFPISPQGSSPFSSLFSSRFFSLCFSFFQPQIHPLPYDFPTGLGDEHSAAFQLFCCEQKRHQGTLAANLMKTKVSCKGKADEKCSRSSPSVHILWGVSFYP